MLWDLGPLVKPRYDPVSSTSSLFVFFRRVGPISLGSISLSPNQEVANISDEDMSLEFQLGKEILLRKAVGKICQLLKYWCNGEG